MVFKYVFRDTLLGLFCFIPGALGVLLRMVFVPVFLKKCGKSLTLREGVIFQFPERIEVGSHVGIGHFSVVDGTGGLKIGDFVRIGPQSTIITFNHKFRKRNIKIKLQGKEKKTTVIGNDVWVGAGVRILAGVKIGEGAVLAAGAVVNKNIPPFSVVAGVPARVISRRI